MNGYYLWSGIGAIEDIEAGDHDGALLHLTRMTSGNWTLWHRDGMNAILIAAWFPANDAPWNLILFQERR